jgi:hypothetical protein
MYDSGFASSFHGIIKMPTTPVISPPILNEIARGARLAKSFAGLTTFAAMFTDSVAIPIPRSAMIATMTRVAAEAISGSAWPGGGDEDVSCARM